MRINEDYLECYCKGSPEKLRELCVSESIPHDFEHILSQYTAQGFRVLGIAYKMLRERKTELSRKDVEKDLIFLGFFILENRLKPITSSILQKLSKAKIRSIMVTGDNVR